MFNLVCFMPKPKRNKLSNINSQRTYLLDEAYKSIMERAKSVLKKYWKYPDLITFNALERSVTFTSERLIPAASPKRLQVMLLFSNPHPHSVSQGMFLSPVMRHTPLDKNSFYVAEGLI